MYLSGRIDTEGGRSYAPETMPKLLADLVAFMEEHRYCAGLEGGVQGALVRMACACGAELVRLVGSRDEDQSVARQD